MLIKKIFTVLFLLFSLSSFALSADYGDISAYSAVVINADTKEILYEKNAYTRRSMASTTKIMTSILAIESGKLLQSVVMTDEAMAEGTSIGLKSGYKLSLESLVYGMLLESGNDAANLCALHLSGSHEAFSELMNRKAAEIGMTETNFVTPSGLDDENHYSTAYDMALLGAYCVENPMFRSMCSCQSKTIKLIEPQISLTFHNHNRLLKECEGVFGIKTGFTKKSGRCLVTACERDGATLICVTLNAGDDWNDHTKLYDWCFADLKRKTVNPIDTENVKIYGSEKENISIYCDDLTYHYKNSYDNVEATICLPKIIYAPVEKNEIIGKITLSYSGTIISESYIYANESASCKEPTYKKNSFVEWIKNIFSD